MNACGVDKPALKLARLVAVGVLICGCEKGATTDPVDSSHGGSVTLGIRSVSVYDTLLVVSVGATNYVSVRVEADSGVTPDVSVSGMPAGVTATIRAVKPVYVIDVTAAPGTQPQRTPLTVYARANGKENSVPLTLVLQEPPPKRGIAFNICTGFDNSNSIGGYAFSNDGEGWQSVALGSDGFIRFDATPLVRFRYQYGLGSPAGSPIVYATVIHSTANELEEIRCSPSAGGTKTFGLQSWQSVEPFRATLGAYSFFKAATSTFSNGKSALNGPQDLIAATNRASPNAQRIVVRRGLDLPNRDPIPVVDFNGPEAWSLDSATLSTNPVSTLLVDVGLQTASAVLTYNAFQPQGSGGTYWALNASRLLPTDMQLLYVRSGTAERGLVHYFRTPTNKSFDIGPGLSPATNIGGGVWRIDRQSSYPDIAAMRYFAPICGGCSHPGVVHVDAFVTKSFLGGAPEHWDFRMPDFGSGGIFEPAGALMVASGRLGVLFGGAALDGETMRFAGRPDYLPYPRMR